MGIFNKLLGKTPAKSRDGGISVYAMLADMGIKMSPQRCAIDGGTFSCPPVIPNLNGADGMTIDIGGYCPSCRTYCCPKHVQYKRSGYVSGDLTCAQCGSVLTGGPRLDDGTDSDLIRIVVDRAAEVLCRRRRRGRCPEKPAILTVCCPFDPDVPHRDALHARWGSGR